MIQIKRCEFAESVIAPSLRGKTHDGGLARLNVKLTKTSEMNGRDDGAIDNARIRTRRRFADDRYHPSPMAVMVANALPFVTVPLNKSNSDCNTSIAAELRRSRNFVRSDALA